MRSSATSKNVLYALVFLFSACSIGYELVLARQFALMSSQEIVWHSLTIAVYVLALGVGTMLADRLLQNPKVGEYNTAQNLFWVEICLTVLGISSVYLVEQAHALLRIFALPELIRLSSYVYLQPVDYGILLGQILCFAIGTLSGFEIPLMAKLIEGDQSANENRNTHNKVLAVNYIGTLAGTLLFLFVLTPFASLGKACWVIGIVNFFCALFLYFHLSEKAVVHASSLAAMLVSLLCIFVVGTQSDDAEQFALKAGYYISNRDAAAQNFTKPSPAVVKNYSPIVINRSAYQTLHLVRPPLLAGARDELLPGEPFTLYIDRHFQISSEHEALYHEFFIHYPIGLMGKTPEKVLVLGGGDGLAARELLRYSKIRSITQIEIDPEMIRLATTHPAFTNLNKNSLINERVHLVQDDAFTFLKRHQENYDAVFIDFPYPFNFDLSRLYSKEFYSFVHRNVKPTGFIVLDAPLIAKNDPNQTAKPLNDILASTLASGGFQFISPFGGEGAVKFDRETFVIALPRLPDGPPPPFQEPEIPFRFLFQPGTKHLHHADFDFKIDPKLVNSIFKPTLLLFRDSFL